MNHHARLGQVDLGFDSPLRCVCLNNLPSIPYIFFVKNICFLFYFFYFPDSSEIVAWVIKLYSFFFNLLAIVKHCFEFNISDHKKLLRITVV